MFDFPSVSLSKIPSKILCSSGRSGTLAARGGVLPPLQPNCSWSRKADSSQARRRLYQAGRPPTPACASSRPRLITKISATTIHSVVVNTIVLMAVKVLDDAG